MGDNVETSSTRFSKILKSYRSLYFLIYTIQSYANLKATRGLIGWQKIVKCESDSNYQFDFLYFRSKLFINLLFSIFYNNDDFKWFFENDINTIFIEHNTIFLEFNMRCFVVQYQVFVGQYHVFVVQYHVFQHTINGF